jgi:hypothetical protein
VGAVDVVLLAGTSDDFDRTDRRSGHAGAVEPVITKRGPIEAPAEPIASDRAWFVGQIVEKVRDDESSESDDVDDFGRR